MPARRVTSVTVTKLLLDVVFWVSGIAAVLFTLFLVLSPLAMHDGFVADAAFPVAPHMEPIQFRHPLQQGRGALTHHPADMGPRQTLP